jgi:hypothetical protein
MVFCLNVNAHAQLECVSREKTGLDLQLCFLNPSLGGSLLMPFSIPLNFVDICALFPCS